MAIDGIEIIVLFVLAIGAIINYLFFDQGGPKHHIRDIKDNPREMLRHLGPKRFHGESGSTGTTPSGASKMSKKELGAEEERIARESAALIKSINSDLTKLVPLLDNAHNEIDESKRYLNQATYQRSIVTLNNAIRTLANSKGKIITLIKSKINPLVEHIKIVEARAGRFVTKHNLASYLNKAHRDLLHEFTEINGEETPAFFDKLVQELQAVIRMINEEVREGFRNPDQIISYLDDIKNAITEIKTHVENTQREISEIQARIQGVSQETSDAGSNSSIR